MIETLNWVLAGFVVTLDLIALGALLIDVIGEWRYHR